MKKSILCSGLAGVLSFAFIGCDIEQTREGEMPNVEVEGGQMPAYDVDAPDVDVTTEQEKVTVPDVDVDMEEKTIEVPKVDVDLPEDN